MSRLAKLTCAWLVAPSWLFEAAAQRNTGIPISDHDDFDDFGGDFGGDFLKRYIEVDRDEDDDAASSASLWEEGEESGEYPLLKATLAAIDDKVTEETVERALINAETLWAEALEARTVAQALSAEADQMAASSHDTSAAAVKSANAITDALKFDLSMLDTSTKAQDAALAAAEKLREAVDAVEKASKLEEKAHEALVVAEILAGALEDGEGDERMADLPEEDKCERRRRRLAEGGAAACVSAECHSERFWLREWHSRMECWLFVRSHRACVQACLGSLQIHLAQRFEQTMRARGVHYPQDGPAQSLKAQTAAKGRSEYGCEWISDDTAELELPEFPSLDFEWTIPPIPRLFLSWPRVHALAPAEPRGRVAKRMASEAQLVTVAAIGFGMAAFVGAVNCFAIMRTRRNDGVGGRVRIQIRRETPTRGVLVACAQSNVKSCRAPQ